MIEHNGKKFYSTYEISQMLSPDHTDRLNLAWKQYYNKYCRGEVQMILDKARKCNAVRHIRYTTQPAGGKTRYAYSLEDVVDFVEKGIPLNKLITSCGVYNVEYK